MFINTLSESKSKTFNQCGLKYKFKYINRLEETASNTDALHFGSFIHKIFEDGVEATNVDALYTIAESIRKDYKFSAAHEKKIDTCLKNFLRFNASLEEVGSTELVYEIVEDKKYDIKFNGIIDRIIKGKEGGYLIIDYKTSKRESTKFDLYSDMQLQGYAYAIHKKFKVPIDKIVAAHYYPVSNNFVTVKYSLPQIAQYVRTKKEEIWKIRKMKSCEFQASENRFCNWCGYKNLCPLFTEAHAITENRKKAKTRKKRK